MIEQASVLTALDRAERCLYAGAVEQAIFELTHAVIVAESGFMDDEERGRMLARVASINRAANGGVQ